MMKKTLRAALFGVAAGLSLTVAGISLYQNQAGAATSGERVQVTGEILDTWCYYSGVMGTDDAVLGSAHHTCAIWCAAGGIPIGLLTDDGQVYMVLHLANEGPATASPTVLDLQSSVVTADGMSYERDGMKYLVVEEIVTDEGILRKTHQDYGTVPPFAVSKPAKKAILENAGKSQ